MQFTVRPLTRADRDAWFRLWAGYLEFYGTELDEEEMAFQFERRLSDDRADFRCLLACADGKPVGLAHYVFHRHGWKREDVCYLQDLFVEKSMRDYGLGQTLLGAVFAVADGAGSPAVYWMTQDSNRTARKLYDRLGNLTTFVKYERR